MPPRPSTSVRSSAPSCAWPSRWRWASCCSWSAWRSWSSAWPQIHDIRLATIPLPWWLLGVAVYPLILLSAFLFNMAAARNEAQYRSIVDQ